MKTSKKFLTGIILMLTLMLCLAFGASAEETYKEGDYTYTVTDGKAAITSVSSSISGDVVIPETLGGYPVKEIGEGSFAGTNITGVTISDNVLVIADYAFYLCRTLEKVSFGKNVESIGEFAFFQCKSLTYVELPNSIKYIEHGAFDQCFNLKEAVLPYGITSVSGSLFWQCISLEKVTIPVSVKNIESSAFYWCEELKDVYYGGTEEQWSNVVINESGNEALLKATVHYNSLPVHTHSYTSVTTPATCTSNGQTVYTCTCNDTYTEIIPTTGHNYENAVCTECGDSKADDCSHLCHKSGFMGFIWKIVQFFWKLFKINPVCECGMAHY